MGSLRTFVVCFALLLVGCPGKFDIVKPTTAPVIENVKIIEKARDAVWDAAVPALGKLYFLINNMDRSSGFINLSYSGDPETYIDCGRIISYVKNIHGERTHDFPASRAHQTYEVINEQGAFFIVDRRMSLEGRVNLVFEAMSPTRTRITANTRYVVSRTVLLRGVQGPINTTISFNAGATASFPPTNDGRAVQCVSTGRIERDILSLIN